MENTNQETLLTSHCTVVAEVAQAHDGSLGMAHAFIDAVAKAGADAVKFQTHIATAESTPEEPWRVKFSRQDKSRFEYWQRMEFSPEQWQELRSHAHERGLLFISSPFSIEAVELLERTGIDAWKLASGEVSNTPMIERIAASDRPILFSTGMSPWSEIDVVVALLRSAEIPFAVLQCTSMYPTPPDSVGLNVLDQLRNRYECAVGLSDHSGTIYPGLVAAALGASVVEVHTTLSREMFGPDVVASVTTSELKQLVDGIRFVEKMMAHPVDKDEISEDLGSVRSLFTKSLVFTSDLPRGTILESKHLTGKKPGTGIPISHLRNIVGRKLDRDVHRDDALRESHLV